jgi:hypothetical protein
MILTLKLVPPDLSAVTVAAAPTETRHRLRFVQNITLNCTVGCRLMGVRRDGKAKNYDENGNNNNIIITTMLSIHIL